MPPLTKEEIVSALMAGTITAAREGICPVCGKAFTAPHKRMTCGELHCSRTIGFCNRKVIKERQNQRDEKLLRRAHQDMHSWIVDYGDGYFYSADIMHGF